MNNRDPDSKELPAYGINAARTNITDLVNRAAYAGERILITCNGRPKAAIVPMADLERLTQHAA